MNKIQHMIFTLVTLLLISGCIFSSSGSNKSDNDPRITSLSLENGKVFTDADLTVSWEGNSAAQLYQYSMDGTYSDWSELTSAEFVGLSEGAHIFTVKAQRDSIISDEITRNFEIDAIQGTAIVFTPRKISDISNVDISIEGASELMAAHIEIVCENGSARIFEFSPAETDNNQPIVLSDTSNQSRLVLDIGYYAIQTENTESRLIGTMLVQPLLSGGRVVIHSGNTTMRNFSNELIQIDAFDEILIGK